MSVFDPHGYAAPILVHGKILLQSIWRQELDWDQQLTENLNHMFLQWMDDLQLIEDVALSRCLSGSLLSADRIEIHCFVDASEDAFAAVCYLRVVSQNEIEVSLIGSKNKVAPKKQLSIPKLELQAAVLGARLVQCVTKELTTKIDGKWFWSDSKTVLAWIRSDHRRYTQFVGNRISEILDTSSIKEWRWVPTAVNVADQATKKPKNIDLSPLGLWMTGPEFLKLKQEEWPKFELNTLECQEELRPQRLHLHKHLDNRFDVLNVERFSKWNRLLRACAYVLRGKQKFMKRSNTIELCAEVKNVPGLSVQELTDAEKWILKKAQWECFTEEVNYEHCHHFWMKMESSE